MAWRRDKDAERRVAQTRVGMLLEAARDAVVTHERDRADRYAVLAKRVAMKYQIGLGRSGKARICACGAHRDGATGRTRLRAGKVVVTCLRCGQVRRVPLGPAPAAAPASPSATASAPGSPSARSPASHSRSRTRAP